MTIIIIVNLTIRLNTKYISFFPLVKYIDAYSVKQHCKQLYYNYLAYFPRKKNTKMSRYVNDKTQPHITKGNILSTILNKVLEHLSYSNLLWLPTPQKRKEECCLKSTSFLSFKDLIYTISLAFYKMSQEFLWSIIATGESNYH